MVMQEIPMTRMPIWRASDGFTGGAHADRVCAEGAAHGDFLRGLVLRAGELQINAFHQVDIKAGCGFPCDFLESRS